MVEVLPARDVNGITSAGRGPDAHAPRRDVQHADRADLGYSAFVWLLEHVPVSTVATYAYVNPVVALVSGWALLGEGLTATMAAGSVVVLASVALVVRREHSR